MADDQVATVTFDKVDNVDVQSQDTEGNSYVQEATIESSFVDIVSEGDAADTDERVHSDTVTSFDILQSVSVGE